MTLNARPDFTPRAEEEASRPAFHADHAYQMTQPPHPAWTPGIEQPHPAGRVTRKVFAPQDVPPASMYAFLVSAVVPRPIALTATVNAEGLVNMAPFSYFNVVCHRPPVVMISINVPPAGPKDTLANIKASGEFTVNIMSEWYVNSANYTCINAPAGYDEMAAGGVAKQPSTVVKPPLAADAAISFECTVLDPARTGTPMVPLRDDDGNVNTTVVFGLIEQVHVREDVLDERGNVDLAKLKPLGRAGGNDYVRVLEGFTLRRPAYSEGKQS